MFLQGHKSYSLLALSCGICSVLCITRHLNPSGVFSIRLLICIFGAVALRRCSVMLECKYVFQSVPNITASVRQDDTRWPQWIVLAFTSQVAPPSPMVLCRGRFINYHRMFDWHRLNDRALLLTCLLACHVVKMQLLIAFLQTLKNI